jgi:ubiquinone/menaquinone biosynthesis C-methylase UbiE
VARGAFGVGVDMAADAGLIGRERFRCEGLERRVAFVQGDGSALPFPSGVFDLLICRVALPYMHNPSALAEMARVLRPAGLLFLKIHHAWFYVDEAWRGLLAGQLLPFVHAMRVLASGIVYHATDWHLQNRMFKAETFQSKWLLERVLARHQMVVVRELSDSNRLSPSFLIRKAA